MWISYEDRQVIEKHYGKLPVSQIAKLIQKSESALWRELKRGGVPYSAKTAQESAEETQGTLKRLRAERDRERVDKIKAGLKENPDLKIVDFMRILKTSRPLVAESYKKALMELYQESYDKKEM